MANASTDALLGDTGFVGGILAGQHRFDAGFSRRNIEASASGTFRTVVCAAAPGSMFEANRFPERDRAGIDALIAHLARLRCDRFVLISSIAVFDDFAGADDEGSTAFETSLTYGRHRRALEAFCEEHFADCLVVRLPALFGPGLRKNFVFDLLHPIPTLWTPENVAALADALPATLADLVCSAYAPDPATGLLRVDRAALAASPHGAALNEAARDLGMTAARFHHPDTTYQYYDLSRLWSDIAVAREAGLRTIHLTTEPLQAARIHARLTGRPMPASNARVHHEDLRTRHAALWGRTGPYLDDADAILDRLAAFFGAEQESAP